jgi:hypothetical protein
MPIILAFWEAEIGSIKVQGQPRQIAHEIPISKITSAKWTEVVAQSIEYLLFKPFLCKQEAMSSNSNPTQKREEERTQAQQTGVFKAFQN